MHLLSIGFEEEYLVRYPEMQARLMLTSSECLVAGVELVELRTSSSIPHASLIRPSKNVEEPH